jgi:hypothetical protein
MKTKDDSNQAFVQALLRMGLKHPNTEQSLACRGTVVESATVKVEGKAFLFVRPIHVMMKVDAATAEATRMAAAEPERYIVGKGGWITIKLKLGEPTPPLPLLERWIAESYRLQVGKAAKEKTPAGGVATAKKKAAVKKTSVSR